MTEPNGTAQIQTRRREIGRPMPRRFSQTAWWRFSRDRRRELLARLSGPPTHQQVSLIASIAQLEWNALRNEAEALTLTGREARDAAREGREHRRLLANLLSDFERSLTPKAPPKPAKTRLAPPQLTLEEHMAKLRERREGTA
jgi:hypothetical protein